MCRTLSQGSVPVERGLVATVARGYRLDCQYCGASNLTEDERCTRCGRRLHAANPRPMPEGYRPAFEAASPARVPPAGQGSGPASQPDLFPAPAQDRPKVVSISGAAAAPAVARKPAERQKAARKPPGTDRQQHFVFAPPAPRRAAEAPSEKYCDAPVATTQHRMIAAFIDMGIVLAAYAVMLSTFVLWEGGGLRVDPVSIGIAAALWLMLTLLYQSLWVLANGDSAGLRWSRLTLVDFDGRRPNRKQRMQRMAASWLSVAPAGLGLFWALMDEEALAWHDQISKTFPSPIDAGR